ncbi:MAG: FAD-dependent oxidoreductase [Planctomycetota bacterium]|nr:FAD-dependent oxidoreductase [Planctomycetota bacterium]
MKHRTVILGAGITGLAAACRLGRSALVLEKENSVGGLCRTFRTRGFTFDTSGHVLYFRDDRIRSFVTQVLLKGDVTWHERRASVAIGGRRIPYPFQHHLRALPERLRRECEDGLANRVSNAGEPRDFLEWTTRRFGDGIVRHFMLPFNEKLWRHRLDELDWDWARRLVPTVQPDESDSTTCGGDGVSHAGGRTRTRAACGRRTGDTPIGYNRRFAYPVKGGIGTLARAFAAHATGEIRTGTECVGIDLHGRIVRLRNGTSVKYDSLVSTLSLPALVMMARPCPDSVKRSAIRLKTLSVCSICYGLTHRVASDNHWTYFPEPGVSFFRVVFPSEYSRNSTPEGCGSLCVEVSGLPESMPCSERERAALLEKVRSGLVQVGLLGRREKPAVARVVLIRNAYPIPTIGSRAAVEEIRAFLRRRGVVAAGRFGGWAHLGIEDCVLEGFRAAETE